MYVSCVRALGFRNLAIQELELSGGTTVLWGSNGGGKTNVLEAICVALSGRSCRTRADREMIAFGEPLARVELALGEGRDVHTMLWSLSRDGDRRHLVEGKPMVRDQAHLRPALAIFLPDRLALIKGPPAVRRTHVDRLVAALWPGRASVRPRYGRALAQRNALVARARPGGAGDSLDAWERELAAAGIELAATRGDAVAAMAPEFRTAATELGLPGEAELRYLSRSDARDPAQLATELRERREVDVRRGHTTHGPHLDELEISLEGRSLRRYGSQGEQRVALLALLFAERRALLEARRAPPLMLLDDVMSELDADRRMMLARRLAEGGGQAIVTATEPGQLSGDFPRREVELQAGRVSPPPAPAVLDAPSPVSTSVAA